MACIHLWSSAVRAHDSQAYRKMDVTRERISRILELREILLSIQTCFIFSLVKAAVVCAILDSISGLEPSSVITGKDRSPIPQRTADGSFWRKNWNLEERSFLYPSKNCWLFVLMTKLRLGRKIVPLSLKELLTVCFDDKTEAWKKDRSSVLQRTVDGMFDDETEAWRKDHSPIPQRVIAGMLWHRNLRLEGDSLASSLVRTITVWCGQLWRESLFSRIPNRTRRSLLVSWCLKPSQPQRITSGLILPEKSLTLCLSGAILKKKLIFAHL